MAPALERRAPFRDERDRRENLGVVHLPRLSWGAQERKDNGKK